MDDQEVEKLYATDQQFHDDVGAAFQLAAESWMKKTGQRRLDYRDSQLVFYGAAFAVASKRETTKSETGFGDKTADQVRERVENVRDALFRLSEDLGEAVRPSWKCCNECCPVDYHPYAGMHKEPCKHWELTHNQEVAEGIKP